MIGPQQYQTSPPKAAVPRKVFNANMIQMHPQAQRHHARISEIDWQFQALQIHAKLQPTEADKESNLLDELKKDYGMFDNNKKMHMRNLNRDLTLHDVVNFHEIISPGAQSIQQASITT